MIAIVDFGSQLTHLIGRRLKNSGIVSTIVLPEEAIAFVSDSTHDVKGVILSGGPASVYESGAPSIDLKLFELNVPVLGICYGWQLMAHLLGGQVESTAKEYGKQSLTVSHETLGLAGKLSVIMSHGDSVTKLPEHFVVYGSTQQVSYAFVGRPDRQWYGVQFHPEADHTQDGAKLLTAFAVVICHEEPSTITLSVNELVREINEKVGNEAVLMAVSGGVDSTVAAALIARAIGKQLTVVYVESGLMRSGTREWVEHIFTTIVPAKLVVVDAQTEFASALVGVTDSEKKRKIIGDLYVQLFDRQAKQMGGIAWLGQGTIYSDVIESKGSTHAQTIKSHHNVGGLPENLSFKLLEPIRTLYKDEVRQLGNALRLPEEVVSQQPFPGPGYAIRIRGEVTLERLNQVKKADEIVMEEVRRAGLWNRVFQCFAVMTGASSTSVKGDGRYVAEVVAIRAYESNDIMTSQVAQLPFELLETMSHRIVNEVPEVSRVVYDITSKPPATMEWE